LIDEGGVEIPRGLLKRGGGRGRNGWGKFRVEGSEKSQKGIKGGSQKMEKTKKRFGRR